MGKTTITRADLIAQRDALQAQIDALPPEPVVETVRVYADETALADRQRVDALYYLDVTIIDGVPQGWTKIEGGE